jgi:putative transposase
MPRRALIRSSVTPYHVYNRVNNREEWALPKPEMWRLFTQQWYETADLMDVHTHSLVMMSNHFHSTLTTPGPDLGEVMEHFEIRLTKSYNRTTGREGHLFKGRYGWNIIEEPRYFSNVTKYILRNPVSAGMVSKVEDYPYSSIFGQMGGGHLPIKLFHPTDGFGDELISEDGSEYLRWLNESYSEEQVAAIKKGLKKRTFALPKSRSRRPFPNF